MKPIDVKSNTNIDSNKENKDQHPTFKIGDTIRISKYNISKYFCKMLHSKLVSRSFCN